MKRRIVVPAETSTSRPLHAHRVERTLTLPLKGVYFDEMKADTKVEEFRLCTPHRGKRLLERGYDTITLTKYPAAGDAESRTVLTWRGHAIKMNQHPLFGAEAVSVFGLGVSLALPLPGSNFDSLPHGSNATHWRESS